MGGDNADVRGIQGQAPEASARRKQSAIDVATALILTILVWPFPLARVSLTPLVHVISILVLWQLMQVGYFAVSAAVWRKTAGMHLLGLGLADADGCVPARGAAVTWGLLAGVSALPRLVSGGPAPPLPDFAERSSVVRVVVTG